jgi:hypothetical protein
VWPGEEPVDPVEESSITDRDADFVAFVIADTKRRREAEDEFYRSLGRNDEAEP